MPMYVVLGNWTDQGIRNVKETPKRENAFHELCEKFDARVKDVYRTMGIHDSFGYNFSTRKRILSPLHSLK